MRILIIGNTSEEHHLGAVFLRAAREIGVEANAIDINFSAYAPSMRTLIGRLFFKLAGKRAMEWGTLNKTIFEAIQSFRPSVLLVTGIVPLDNRLFYFCSQNEIQTVNFLTDYPWNPIHRCPLFVRNLPNYCCVASTKSSIITELSKKGAVRPMFLPFGFDPTLHHFWDDSDDNSGQIGAEIPDILFVGTADRERIPYLKVFSANETINLRVHGAGWNKKRLGITGLPPLSGAAFRTTVRKSRINLGIVRKANMDQSTMRSFEIPACGGLGIYEDTAEHREIFAGYPEEGFFRSPEDLALKCNRLLADPSKREEMREMGMRLVRHEGNTYAARLRTMIDWASS